MSLVIPQWMLTDEIQIEDYAGQTGAGGPAYSAAVTVRSHVETRRKLLIDSQRREVRSDMFAIVRPDVVVQPEARVTYDGLVFRVIDVFKVPAPGGGTHHLELGMAFSRA